MSEHPALAALRDGRIGELATLYEPEATLDLSVPDRRQVVSGADAIAEALSETFRDGLEAVSWDARVFAAGAAITLERPPWRQRHYLHLTSSAISAHWVYAAGLAASVQSPSCRRPCASEPARSRSRS